MQGGANDGQEDTEKRLILPKSPKQGVRSKAGCQEQKQSTMHVPCTQHQKGWADHPSHPFGPTPGPTSTLTA